MVPLLPSCSPTQEPTHAREKHKLKRDWSVNMGESATVGSGQYPGKFGFDVNSSSCANDYVVFNTGLAGSASQASIIAYNNLYSGCGETVPSSYFAYNTGGKITTSVTLSADGTQLAFVQAPTGGGAAELVLLTWATPGGAAGAPGPITTVSSPSSYRGCTAPCMTTITFKRTTGTDPTPTVLISAPFYDFSGSDTLYVGDDAGYLHQFTNVFISGTPVESTSTWSVEVGKTNLSSPVYDPTTGNVFVTAAYVESFNSGGQLAAVCATSTCAGVSNGVATTAIGTVTLSGVLGPATSGTVCHGNGSLGSGNDLRLDSPIVDPVAGRVYAFLGTDGNGNSAVVQFPTTVSATEFSARSCGTESTVGTGSTTGFNTPLFSGTFDNLYFTSSGSSPSGNLYVCGNTSGNPALYQVPITNNGIPTGGTLVLANLSTGATTCSPVTEVFNSPADWIFLSVEHLGTTASPVGCPMSAGCVMSFSVPTSSPGAPPTSTFATATESGGTSGIVIDNIVTQGSEIYFSTLTGSNAVQASQSGLE